MVIVTVIKKMNRLCVPLFFLLLLNIFFCENRVLAAEKSDAAKQALEQLRLLQKQFNAQSTNDGSAPSAAPPPPAPDGPIVTPIVPPKPAIILRPQAPAAVIVEKPVVARPVAPPPAVGDIGEEVINERAFSGLSQQLFPLTPAQIIQLKQMYATNELAKAAPLGGIPPKPTATSQFVNLSPGSTPPVIRLAQGFVSSLVFLDSTGAPWPISAYDLGDPTSFNIQWDKTSNTLMIQAIKLYNYGNLAVRLKGLNTPVMLTLIPGQKAVDYRVDLRVQGYGPQAINLPMEEGLPPSANDVLLHVLEGVPPPGSQRLVVSGGDARAWFLNDKMYVRTNLTILSPGWLASMTSADGTHAYEMQKSPVLLVSWHGKVMQLKVEGL